jgi:hypothetical protein
MTSPITSVLAPSLPPPVVLSPTTQTPQPAGSPYAVAARFAVSALLLAGYFAFYGKIIGVFSVAMETLTRAEPTPATPRVIAVTLLGILLVSVWWRLIKSDPRFHAPILITYILALGDISFGILENHHSAWLEWLTGGRLTSYSPTFIAILATVTMELILARFVAGKWPHLASAYISGISVGILIKSPELWPFVLCGLISITSKYVLRVGGRHLWNPTNFGVTMMLFLAPEHVASLSVQSGNEVWPVLLIWALGSLILYRFGLLHIPLVFLAAFIPLAFVRSAVTSNPWQAELAPMTSPMFQLYIFFMITDPKTVTRTRGRQCLVAVLIAVVETILRLGLRDIYSLFHALFIVGPIANLIEIRWTAKQKATAVMGGPSSVSCPPTAG